VGVVRKGYSVIKRIGLLMMVALVAAMMMVATAAPAFAKITPAEPPSCETGGGGNLPPGQQPTCQGGGLEQNEATPATNPAGAAPPGQQP